MAGDAQLVDLVSMQDLDLIPALHQELAVDLPFD